MKKIKYRFRTQIDDKAERITKYNTEKTDDLAFQFFLFANLRHMNALFVPETRDSNNIPNVPKSLTPSRTKRK